MLRNDYIKKTLEFFANNQIHEIQTDPTPKFQEKIRKCLNNSNFLFTKNEVQNLIVMNPTAPRLRSQPKVHKTNTPIRPIVNSINSPAYKLMRELHDLLIEKYTFEKTYNIKNSYELLNSMNDLIVPPQAKFLSLDIVNLYTSIPVDETIEIIRINLLKNNTMSTPEIIELIDALNLVLSHNYFSFNNKIYKQDQGLAMGSPLSGLLAEIFINHIENKILTLHDNITSKIKLYKRYVDDTLILFDGTDDEITNLFNKFNNLHKNIKFTLEHEENNIIPFLDIKISKQNQKVTYSVYRKPTCTDTTIPHSSTHPTSHKKAAYRSMLYRAHKFPLQHTELQQEVETINHIAINNGFDPSLINTMSQQIKKKLNKQHNITLTTDTTPSVKYVKMPYLGIMSDKLARLFKNTEVKISFSTNNNLGRKLIHNTKPLDTKFDASGIYKITCSQCDKYYIGQTGRNFKTRFKEHLDCYRLNKYNKSAIATHIKETGHPVKIEENLKILHKINKSKRMNVMEQMEIFIHKTKSGDSILNEITEFKNSAFFNSLKPVLMQ